VRLLQLVRGFNAGEDPSKGLLNDGHQPVRLARLPFPQSPSWKRPEDRVGRKRPPVPRFSADADGECQPEALEALLCGEIARTTGSAGAGGGVFC